MYAEFVKATPAACSAFRVVALLKAASGKIESIAVIPRLS